MDIVCFLQEDRWYGLFASAAADLVPSVEIASVRAPPPCLLGFATYRNRLLPAIRLGALFSARPTAARADSGRPRGPRRPTSLLVVRDGERRLGLPSESIGCVLEVSRQSLGPVRGDDSSVGRLALQHRDRHITVLDAARLVRLVHVALGGEGGFWSARDEGARH